jgi:hypothetical protein
LLDEPADDDERGSQIQVEVDDLPSRSVQRRSLP